MAGPVPPHQRLQRDDPPRAEFDLRLELQVQMTLGDRRAQLGFPVQPHYGVGVHPSLEDNRHPPTGRLGTVQRGVRRPE